MKLPIILKDNSYFFALLLSMAMFIGCNSAQAQQRVKVDAKGNYVVASRDTAVNKATGKTITDKDGVSHPVFQSRTGRLYYLRISRNGNQYKSYLKVE